ncbi:ATP-dependent RNA helicase DHX30 isoform X2 [Pelobates cultripes]|uniref:ATP-dependent RNA helicase DHX30 n=1 Tax=Pelobates cultripes TaxID=61616 RepID=A0AAD1RUC0_PELCU|nr:ATP-dependent RNA helicase DHX30 isoform X2 [Pelobates cultripes]
MAAYRVLMPLFGRVLCRLSGQPVRPRFAGISRAQPLGEVEGRSRETERDSCDLLKEFPEPKSLLNNVISRALGSTEIKDKLVYTHISNANKYRVTLHVKWPKHIEVQGYGLKKIDAERQAAAVACKMFQDMGLLGPGNELFRQKKYRVLATHFHSDGEGTSGDIYMSGQDPGAENKGKSEESEVMEGVTNRLPRTRHDGRKSNKDLRYSILDAEDDANAVKALAQFPHPKNLLTRLIQIATSSPTSREFIKYQHEGGRVKTCKLTLNWPEPLTFVARAVRRSEAENKAAALACQKLKVLGLLDSNNQPLSHARYNMEYIQQLREQQRQPKRFQVPERVLQKIEDYLYQSMRDQYQEKNKANLLQIGVGYSDDVLSCWSLGLLHFSVDSSGVAISTHPENLVVGLGLPSNMSRCPISLSQADTYALLFKSGTCQRSASLSAYITALSNSEHYSHQNNYSLLNLFCDPLRQHFQFIGVAELLSGPRPARTDRKCTLGEGGGETRWILPSGFTSGHLKHFIELLKSKIGLRLVIVINLEVQMSSFSIGIISLSILCFKHMCPIKPNLLLVNVHSNIPMMDQQNIFQRPPVGVRKIVLATNIAETSVTIDDIVHVVDSGMQKEQRYDLKTKVSCLETTWVSMSNVTQRRGRAGRCQPGFSYHLFTRAQHQAMPPFQEPEILRTPLENLVLQAKLHVPEMTAEEFLSQALESPDRMAIRDAVRRLQEIRVIDKQEQLTLLGNRVANISTDPMLAKAIVLASIFRCLHPMLLVAACLTREPFQGGLQNRSEVNKAKAALSGDSCSDHLAYIRALQGWEDERTHSSTRSREHFLETNMLSRQALRYIQGLVKQFSSNIYEARLVPEQSSCIRRSSQYNQFSSEDELVKSVLLAGLYPNFIQVRRGHVAKGKFKPNSLLYKTKGGSVQLHKTTINRGTQNLHSPWLTYFLAMKSNGVVFVRDSSMVHPLAVLLLADSAVSVTDDGQNMVVALSDSDLLKLESDSRTIRLLGDLRRALSQMVEKSLCQELPSLQPHVEKQYTELLSVLVDLLNSTAHSFSERPHAAA